MNGVFAKWEMWRIPFHAVQSEETLLLCRAFAKPPLPRNPGKEEKDRFAARSPVHFSFSILSISLFGLSLCKQEKKADETGERKEGTNNKGQKAKARLDKSPQKGNLAIQVFFVFYSCLSIL